MMVLLPTAAFARDWKAGLMIGPGITSVDDSAGETEIKTSLSLFNGISTMPFGRDRRIFTHIFYQKMDLPIDNNKVSSTVKSLGVNVSHQWQFRFSWTWKPWIGAGIGFSQDQFTNRVLLDQDGFILRSFSNKEDDAINLLINGSTKITRWNMLDFGIHGQIEIPISGDITRFNIFGTVLF